MLTANEQKAYDAILSWSRSNPRGMGIACMRERTAFHLERLTREGKPAHKFVVIDASRWDSPVLASGDTWIAVAAQLGLSVEG